MKLNILKALNRAFLDEKYRCLFARSGEEALKILEKESVHVIVADMKMPEMDGLTLLKIVKQKYPKIVRVVLSGFTQLPQVLSAINQAGIFRFITKPWNVEEELKVVINQALEYYIIQEEKEQLTKTLEKRNEMYVNVLKATEKKFRELKKNFDVLRDIISYQDSYIIQLLKADRKKDIVIFLLENMKRTISNFISMLPIYPIKFNVDRLVRDLNKTIEERFEGSGSIKIEVKDEAKEYTFEGYYGVLLFTLIEIMMIIIQFDLDAFAVMSIDCVDNKLITIISIPTKIEEKLLLYFLSLTPFVSMLKGTLKIDTQKGKNIDMYIECAFDYVEKNVN